MMIKRLNPPTKSMTESETEATLQADMGRFRFQNIRTPVFDVLRFMVITLLIAMLSIILFVVNSIYAFSISKAFEHLPTSAILVAHECFDY
jgi:hypothetical protein